MKIYRFASHPRMLPTLLLASLFGLFTVDQALAHVRWFVDDAATIETFEPYSLTDAAVIVWMFVALLLVGTSVYLDERLPSIRIVDTKTRHDFIEILRVFTGMSMLLTAYEGSIVAPHLVASGAFGAALLFLQAAIGILLIANRFVSQSAFLMIALHLGLAIKFGVLPAFEYLIMVAIAVFLLINSLQNEKLRDRFKPYSVDMLRILTGISLITLGFSEKLFGAMMAESFLAQYQWNFMQALGLEFFTDRLFALSAGFIEVVFGVILVLGTTTRLNVLAFSTVLFASNMLFLIQGENEAAMIEFIGHMPVIGVALVSLLLGSGQRLKVTNFLPKQGANNPAKSANARPIA